MTKNIKKQNKTRANKKNKLENQNQGKNKKKTKKQHADKRNEKKKHKKLRKMQVLIFSRERLSAGFFQ